MEWPPRPALQKARMDTAQERPLPLRTWITDWQQAATRLKSDRIKKIAERQRGGRRGLLRRAHKRTTQ